MIIVGKTALITGAVKGIGKRTAIELAKNGVNIIINFRSNEEEAYQLSKTLQTDYSVDTLVIKGDVSNVNDCQYIYEQISQKVGKVDILVHNAGPYIHERKKMTEYTLEEWNYLIQGNLTSVFYLSKLFIPEMRKNKWGRIVTIGFDRAETAPGWLYRSAFSVAKTGLVSLTKTIALEEAPFGITCNMVCPGDITSDWKEKEINEAVHFDDKDTPVGRPGTGEDISRVIEFLCNDSSSFITGSIINVTGGKDVLGKKNR